MQALVGILFLLPHFIHAMEVKPESLAPQAPLRGSLSIATDQLSCSAQNPESAEKSGMENVLSSNIAGPGDGAHAPRNSKIHRRTGSAPVPSTPKPQIKSQGIEVIAALNLAAIPRETPSASTATTIKSEKENGEIVMAHTVPQTAAAYSVLEYLSPEAVSFKACFDNLHQVMQLYMKPGTIFYDMHKNESNKKKFFAPILLKTAEELHFDKIGRFKKALPKVIEALLETLFPSTAHHLAHSASSGASAHNQADKKKSAEATPPVKSSWWCCCIKSA